MQSDQSVPDHANVPTVAASQWRLPGRVLDRSPARDRDAFHCPHCGVYAAHVFMEVWLRNYRAEEPTLESPGGAFLMSRCAHCSSECVWRNDALVYPLAREGVDPNPDMPEDVQAIYNEAREVAPISRKSAAGLLRLALQMLVDDLETSRGSIDDKIGRLVRRGLDPQVQQAMDVLRVVGNESVHPGTIDLATDDELVPALFELVNLIVEQVITRPKHVDGLYAMLPQAKRDAIRRRDTCAGAAQP